MRSKSSLGSYGLSSQTGLAKRGRHHSRCRAGETRSPFGAPFKKTANGMTTLDHRLYAWLLESDERRFELAFKAYFDVAYPSVMRRLARLSNWDPVHLEELAQDALLRFFNKVGRERREASVTVRESLSQIRPLNFGLFYERQVTGWAKEVGSFREAAMGFRPPPSDDTEWKTSIRVLADRIPVLQRQGRHLLNSVHMALRWTFDDVDVPVATPKELHDPSDKIGHDDDEVNPTSSTWEEHFVEEMSARTARAVTAENDHPGTTVFVQGTWIIVRALPHLRVPTNGYLFEIAMTIYLDECKKRGRQKRGGTGIRTKDQSEPAEQAEIASDHPLESRIPESFAEVDGEDRFDDVSEMAANSVTGFAMPSVDPVDQYENQDFFEKFYEYLRKPIDEAIDRFHKAHSNGGAVAERRRLDSLTNKFSRTMAVLSTMGEGYTQDQTAQRLGLSRNQVKYIVESVQKAYTRFATDAASTRAATVVGESHVA